MDELFQGHNGQVTLSNEALTISRKGVLGFLTQGLKGEKRIPYSSISAVQYKKAGLVVNGYIQFSILGGIESRGGAFAAGVDENTVMFRSSQNQQFARLRDEVERRVSVAKATKGFATGSTSRAEQLSKLADLLDRGLLSKDEFLAEKAKILAS
jgi:hypothetical protein